MRNALLVKLSISCWTARKQDKDASAEVANNHGSDASLGSYYKQLVSKESIQKISQIVNRARTGQTSFHVKNTLPWADDGTRLLPAANFADYTAGIRQLRSEFEREVERFLDDYDVLISEARRKLNGLFKDADYPTRDQIEAKFSFTTDFWPLPEAGDFRLDLDKEVKNQLTAELSGKLADIQAQAAADCFKRLHEAVAHLQDRCKALDEHAQRGEGRAPKVYDSVVGNLAELVEILPKLNINNDPVLDKLCADVRNKLTVYDAEELKAHHGIRAEAIKQSDAILSQLAGIYGR